MRVLSLSTDEDAPVYEGLLLIFSLFVVNILATASYVSVSTIGHITGMFRHLDGGSFRTSGMAGPVGVVIPDGEPLWTQNTHIVVL